MTNPFLLASSAKGPLGLIKRALTIVRRYGYSSAQMDRSLQQYNDILQHYGCPATFPITAVTLRRSRGIINRYKDKKIEFAVHGYTHIDYSRLSPDKQLSHLQLSSQVFAHAGIKPTGFRSPYLSCANNFYDALIAAGFSYISNQPILWDGVDTPGYDPSKIDSFIRAVNFYNPWLSNKRLSLPRINDNLVEIPVSLPDDEILVDRLGGEKDIAKETWLHILSQSYQLGELFTLQLHPERIPYCADSLSAVLSQARAQSPSVWCASMDEIAAWWNTRVKATIQIEKMTNDVYQCHIDAAKDATILIRAVEVDGSAQPWADGYKEVKSATFTVRSCVIPLIALSPSTPNVLAFFLRQQGYFIEINQHGEDYSYFIDQSDFDVNQERIILEKIEGSGCPLIRLGRWPNGAKSALAVTGDIDALSLWDYGLRLINR